MSLFSRFANVFRGSRLDRELQEELNSHLEMRAAENAKAGMSSEAAAHDARLRLGNQTLLLEQTRQVRIVHWLETLVQDLRYGFRSLRRAPGFTLVAVLTMTLSIGAVTAVFTLVESVLLRPLPYKDPERLVALATFMPRVHREITASPDYFAWKDSSTTLSGVVGYEVEDQNFSGPGDPDRLKGAFTTASIFDVLGVHPILGRGFTADEDKPGAPNLAVLSWSLWQDRFHGDKQVLGTKIVIDSEPTTVIGVMPPTFRFPDAIARPDFLVPMRMNEFKADPNQPMRLMNVLARIKPGIPLDRARVDVQTISDQLMTSFPVGFQRFFAGRTVNLRSLQSELVGGVQRALWIALAAVSFVLLIGCLNIANLQLARAIQRAPEVGIRVALGAARSRILRQFLTENLLLSAFGASGGLLLAYELIALVPSAGLHGIPASSEIRIDRWVLVCTAVVTLASAFIFGLAPGLWATRSDPKKTLSSSTRTTDGSTHRRVRNLLVLAELATALVLLAGAGLMIHSLVRLMSVDAGFDPHHLLTAKLNLLDDHYPTPERRIALAQQLHDKLTSFPEVESVTIASTLPLQPYNGGMGVLVEGQPAPPVGMVPIISTLEVLPGYFHTLRMSIVSGRDFQPSDNHNSDLVAIANKAFVRQFLGEAEPLGKRIRGSRGNSPWATIVGVVNDVRHDGLDQPALPELYFPLPQGANNANAIAIAIRTRYLQGMAAALRREVKAIDSDQPVFDIESMDARLSESIATRRSTMILLACFAGLALTLAAIGIYGVLSYSVTQRAHEIGIRMALGSSRGRVLKLVLNEAVLLALGGVLLGLAGSLALTRFMTRLLYNVRATDPVTMVAVSALLLCISMLAAYLPARRASRVDPMVVLRAE